MLDKLRASLSSLVAQLFFIAAGVYLGNQADQWKEARDHREAARATLKNFRDELRKNRDVVRSRLPYHEALRDSLQTVYVRPVRTPAELQARIRFRGTRSVQFRHTAYDLALTTQALAWLPRDLAFALAEVYTQQATFADIQDMFLQGLYQPGAFASRDPMPMVTALDSYMGDVLYQEPTLVAMYDRLLPRLDSAIARGKH